MHNKLVLILVFTLSCFGLSGCAGIFGSSREMRRLREVSVKQEEMIKALETQLKERDQQIKQLRKELEGFGVFK